MSILSKAKQRIEKYTPATMNWRLGGSPTHNTFNDGLWIHMTPMAFDRQNTLSRSGKSIQNSYSAGLETFTFLAPVTLGFAVRHLYEKYDSIASRAANVYSSYAKTIKETTSMAGNAANAFTNAGPLATSALGKASGSVWSALTGGGLSNLVTAGEAIGGLGRELLDSEGVAFTRVDAPLVYKDSDNIHYAFEFELASFQNPEFEITKPIQSLMTYSCPLPADDLATIYPPYLFKIEAKSRAGGTPLIKVNYAALVTVNPTYSQPYIKGHPSKANLVLEFTDIEPVYRGTFDASQAGIVKVSENKATPEQIEQGKIKLDDYGKNAANTT
jgi:hypothetical protein